MSKSDKEIIADLTGALNASNTAVDALSEIVARIGGDAVTSNLINLEKDFDESLKRNSFQMFIDMPDGSVRYNAEHSIRDAVELAVEMKLVDLAQYENKGLRNKVDRENDALISFLWLQNRCYLDEKEIALAYQRELIETHMTIINGWNSVDDWTREGKTTIQAPALRDHEAFNSTPAQILWVGMFLRSHEKAEPSAVLNMTLQQTAG